MARHAVIDLERNIYLYKGITPLNGKCVGIVSNKTEFSTYINEFTRAIQGFGCINASVIREYTKPLCRQTKPKMGVGIGSLTHTHTHTHTHVSPECIRELWQTCVRAPTQKRTRTLTHLHTHIHANICTGRAAVCCSIWQCAAVYGSVLQCVAVCSSVC